MGRTLCSLRWQCELASHEMKGHSGWERIEFDVFLDEKSNEPLPLLCALREGQIYEASGKELQKLLDTYFPVQTKETLNAFRESLEEHRRTEAEHKAVWGEQSQHL